ncbi:MAG: T9SS type A sorting domain-containing protein, partial [Candidatus Eiseniibacteriota bacterium]
TTIIWPFAPGPVASGQGVVTGAATSDSCFHFYTLRVEGDSEVTVDLIFAEPAYRAPIAFDFDADGTKETLLPAGSGDGTGRIHFVDLCLCVVEPPAPPTCTCPALTGVETEFAEIVLVDLDRDGEQEIVGADVSGKIHVMRLAPEFGELTELPGWPVQLVEGEVASISIGEVDKDGRLEVLASCGGKAYALNYNGTVLPFWPPRVPVRADGQGRAHAPLCLDLTGDDAGEYVGTISDGRLLALRSDASNVSGWPLMAGSSLGASPLALDIDGDGSVELVTLRDVGVEDSLSGEIDVWELGATFTPSVAWWPSYRRDAAHSGVVPDSLSLPVAPAMGVVSELYAMPNPAKGSSVTLHYTLSEEVDRVSIEIYDLSGRLVHSAFPRAFAASDNNYTVELRDFASGVYMFSIEATGGSGRSEKVFSKFAVLK